MKIIRISKSIFSGMTFGVLQCEFEIVISQGSRAQSAQVIENARLYEKEKQLLKVFSQCLNESAKLKEESSDPFHFGNVSLL